MKYKIVAINLGNYGSTGKIMREIGYSAKSKGIFDVTNCYPLSKNDREIEQGDIIICGDIYKRISQRLGWITGLNSCFSIFATLKLISKIKRIQPDIIHLHNIHGGYINIKLLFNYLKKSDVNVVWTLHDCWSFTGGCPYFSLVKCYKWKQHCYKCPQLKVYPSSLIDNTYRMFSLKKKLFCGVKKMTIVTPSIWLAKLVKESYLSNYQIKVINNGINLNIFKPVKNQFKQKMKIFDKKVLLGVSFDWGYRKGLDVMIELSEIIDNNEYQIVLVGTNEIIDKRLPNNIISIHRTNDQSELAEIYSSAYAFINPTREEVLGMVNIEANACGTPVITFNTGGSPECISKNSGIVTIEKTAQSIFNELRNIEKIESIDCVKFAKNFDMNEKFNDYVRIYCDILRCKSNN